MPKYYSLHKAAGGFPAAQLSAAASPAPAAAAAGLAAAAAQSPCTGVYGLCTAAARPGWSSLEGESRKWLGGGRTGELLHCYVC